MTKDDGGSGRYPPVAALGSQAQHSLLHSDGILGGFVATIDRHGGSMRVTVLVGGSWLSGELIPAGTWYALFVDQLRDVGGAESIVAGLDMVRPVIEPRADEPYVPDCLNLIDASVIGDGFESPRGGTLIRVRLDEVGAWFMGTISPGAGCR